MITLRDASYTHSLSGMPLASHTGSFYTATQGSTGIEHQKFFCGMDVAVQ